MAESELKRSIGTGVMRSTSGSGVSWLRSGSNVSPPSSPAEPFGFGEGPYIHASSRAMHDVTKTALGTASLGSRHHTRHETVADTFGWASATPERPWMQRNRTETSPAKRWRVDDRRWMVGSKPDSSPKILKTAQAAAPPRLGDGPRSITMGNVPRRTNPNQDLKVKETALSDFTLYESPKVARGRVLGSRKQNIPLNAITAGERGDKDVEEQALSTTDDLTNAQVEAGKHYENKARRASQREYKPGFAPRRLSSQEEKVADAGWAARKTRQLGKIDRLCDELYEAYSTGQRTGCGAEDARQVENTAGDLLLGMRPLEKESIIEQRRPILLPYPSTDYLMATLSNKPQQVPPQRPPLSIHRKPVSSSSTTTSTLQSQSPVLSPMNPTNNHTRASSSPAIHAPLHPPPLGLRAVQLRSNSSSPPKRSLGARFLPLEPTRPDQEPKSEPLFHQLNLLHVRDDAIREVQPVSNVSATSNAKFYGSATGTVRRRQPAKTGLTKWTQLETVPLPLTFSILQADTSHQASARSFVVDEPSLEGPELLYSSSPCPDQPGTVTLELHPRIKIAFLHMQMWASEVLKQRGWLFWALKVGVLCWVAVVLWTLLDAVREGMRRVLWPATILWDVGTWIVGG